MKSENDPEQQAAIKKSQRSLDSIVKNQNVVLKNQKADLLHSKTNRTAQWPQPTLWP